MKILGKIVNKLKGQYLNQNARYGKVEDDM